MRRNVLPNVAWLIAALCLLAMAGCAKLAGPAYSPPEPPEKAAWSLNAAEPESSAAIAADWWSGFGDAYLSELIERALAESQDIKILVARVEAAGVGLDQERSNNIPKVTLNTGSNASFQRGSTTNNINANLGGLNWELDIWGKVRKSVRAQEAEHHASEADYRAGYLTLTADVGATYLEIRAMDERIDSQRAALEKNQRILGVYQAQFREGIVARTEVLRQQAETRDIKRNLIDLKRQRAIAVNRLASLLGVPAGTFEVARADANQPLQTPPTPAGLPADLLARRPDILAAEYRVLKAHHLIGQARLARLPSISLTGAGGLSSAALSALLDSWTFGLGLALKLPIFDPSIALNIKSREIEHRISEEEYRKTVIQAFEEVENALINLASRKEQLQELAKQLDELRIVNQQKIAQLEAGMVSQLDVLEAERSLLSNEQSLLELKYQILADSITLYKTLGGGWPKQTVALADR